ncbi:MAG: TetR/AcrR family transcriptional regulator [Bacilli bacterium]
MNKNESKYYNTALLMDEALLELLEKKEFDFITVKEICKKAGVSRSTFYLHYISMDDLLRETIEMVNEKFSSSLVSPDSDKELVSSILTVDKFLRPYLLFVKNNLKIYRLIHDKSELFNISKQTEDLYIGLFDRVLSNFGVQENEKKYVFRFYVEGVLGIIKEWIASSCEDDIDLIISLITRNTRANE